MANLFINKLSKGRQCLYSMLLVAIASMLCFGITQFVSYRMIGFLLLLTVSLIAMFFDILPVLLSAVLTAVIWDFFFIPPYFTLTISSTEDVIMLLTYFLIALISAVLTYKIRQVEKEVRDKEDKANTVKLYNTLLNSLSHELRTPIATIVVATDNLLDNNVRLTTQNRYELITEIAKASFRLNQQVENLLNMSRLESGFIAPKNDWCDINEVAYDTVSRIEENKPPQKISISINPYLPLFRLDKGMLEQVLYNLVNNAITYTPPGSKIDITAVNYEDVLQIIVEDNGNGFPEEEKDKVFDRFYRIKNNTAGGTGLGLSIVKGFTEAMGGTIQLANKSEGGAKFTVNIPAKTSFLKNLTNE